MDRRKFLKQAAAAVVVTAVAPQAMIFKQRSLGMTTMAGASRVFVNGGVYELVMDVSDRTWHWFPASRAIFALDTETKSAVS